MLKAGLAFFLATWLAGAARWQPEEVGLVMTVTGLAGLAFNVPAEWWSIGLAGPGH